MDATKRISPATRSIINIVLCYAQYATGTRLLTAQKAYRDGGREVVINKKPKK